MNFHRILLSYAYRFIISIKFFQNVVNLFAVFSVDGSFAQINLILRKIPKENVAQRRGIGVDYL